MDRIRIAFVIDEIGEHPGGTERQLLLLIKHMDKTRFEPYLICLRGSHRLASSFGSCPVRVIDFHSFYSPADYLKLIGLSRFFREKRIDIVQTHLRDGNIAGTLAARLAGAANIVSTRRNHGYWYNRAELVILKTLRRMTTGYLVNSNVIKRLLTEAENIPSEKIEVIYNGVETSVFSSKSEDMKLGSRRALGIPDGCPVVAIVANLRPIKAIDVFLRASAIVAARYSDARFLIAGEGPERENLAALVRESGIEDRVVFLGKRDDISAILSISSVGVLSSRSEGLSNAIIEYMAMGLPVVCTDVGGNPELVEDGRNGFLVPASDHAAMAKAILRILDSPELMKKMGKESFKKARDMFGLDGYIRRTEEYYLRLAGQRARDMRAGASTIGQPEFM